MTLAFRSRRLALGAVLLGLAAATCLVGPWLTADATAIVDPREAGLLPPMSRIWVLTLDDGTVVAGRSAVHEDGVWSIRRAGETVRYPDARVASVNHRLFAFGSDSVGRDVLARLLLGGRVSLGVGGLALAVALVLGIVIGVAAGLVGGLLDGMLMRLVDALLAIPMLFLLLLIAAVFRPSAMVLIFVLGVTSWMGVARLVRSQVLTLKQRDFVLAARAIGGGPIRIAVRHLLPNSIAPVAQDAALRLGDLILTEAALSFLGLGIQPPMPSWGNMASEGQAALQSGWWLVLLPGLAIAAVVVAAAFVADGIGEVARGERSS